MDTNEYPTWKVIFESDKYANFRCGAKYVAWMLSYAFGSILMLLLFVLTLPLRLVPELGIMDKIARALESDTAANIGFGILLLAGIGVLARLAVFAFNHLFQFLEVAGIAIAVGVIGLTGALVLDYTLGLIHKKVLSPAAEKSKQTRGLRRLYGECPVSFDIEPKWFEQLREKLF